MTDQEKACTLARDFLLNGAAGEAIPGIIDHLMACPVRTPDPASCPGQPTVEPGGMSGHQKGAFFLAASNHSWLRNPGNTGGNTPKCGACCQTVQPESAGGSQIGHFQQLQCE